MKMDKDQAMNFIAKRIAGELEYGTLVNLGVGLPTLVSDYVKPEDEILMHAENGLIGVGKSAFSIIDSTSKSESESVENDPNVINSGASTIGIQKGAAFFDSATSFAIIRGGHVDVTVLGTMEVSENGDIANYMIPGKRVAGMGGAMDLCTGCKKVIVATFHTNRGQAKLLKQCKLPLTAKGVVSTIVTEMAVIDVTEEGFVLREYNPSYTIEEIQDVTEATLIIPENVKEIDDIYFEGLN